MKLTKIVCPNCNGQLNIPEGMKEGFVKCKFCNTDVYIEPHKPNITQNIHIDEINYNKTREVPKKNAGLLLFGEFCFLSSFFPQFYLFSYLISFDLPFHLMIRKLLLRIVLSLKMRLQFAFWKMSLENPFPIFPKKSIALYSIWRSKRHQNYLPMLLMNGYFLMPIAQMILASLQKKRPLLYPLQILSMSQIFSPLPDWSA